MNSGGLERKVTWPNFDEAGGGGDEVSIKPRNSKKVKKRSSQLLKKSSSVGFSDTGVPEVPVAIDFAETHTRL